MRSGGARVPLVAMERAWATYLGRRLSWWELNRVAQATAHASGADTVWSPASIRALAEGTDQHPRGTVTSSAAVVATRTGPSGSKPMSRRQAIAHAKAVHAATTGVPDAPKLPADVAGAFDAYRPRPVNRAAWDKNREVARRLAFGFQPRSARSMRNVCSVVAGFLTWYVTAHPRPTSGPVTVDELTVPGLAEAYAAAYRASDASRATLRSVLRRALGSLDPASRPVRLPASGLTAPYTPPECIQLLRLAQHQPTPTGTANLSFLVGLGLGAGLSATDLRYLTPASFTDVCVDRPAPVLMVTVEHGRAPRTVPVRDRYAPLVHRALELHQQVGKTDTDLLVGKVPTRPHVAYPVTSRVRSADPASQVQVNLPRMRNTWLVAAMCAPVPLPDLLRAAGLTSSRTLYELLAHCPDPDPSVVADTVAALARTTDGDQ